MRLFIGLMSGTSVDAIDAALVQISRTAGRYKARVLAHHEHAWPVALRKRLLAIMAPAATTTQELCELNFLVAHEFATAAMTLLESQKIDARHITALASHGQTICHLPPQKSRPTNSKPETRNSKLHTPSTLQLGDLSILATLTSIPTVGNFRPADMAVGGQGAPLVPWTDDALLSHHSKTRCIQNIGGIANVTYLPPLTERKTETWTFFTPASTTTQALRERPPVHAFDTGPGNMLLDAIVSLATNGKSRFDRNGRLAARGTLDAPLLKRLQGHPYFSRRPPKSTGREDFGMAFAQKLLATDHRPLTTLLHTLTRLTAWSIADAYRRFLPRMPDEVILCGGGAQNPTLMAMLNEELGPTPTLHNIDDFGIPNKAKEAASFALLGAATLDHIPANLPAATGAHRAVILGSIADPRPNRGSAVEHL